MGYLINFYRANHTYLELNGPPHAEISNRRQYNLRLIMGGFSYEKKIVPSLDLMIIVLL